MGLKSPSVANEYICSPSCPTFSAGGVVAFTETLVSTYPWAATGTAKVTATVVLERRS